MLAESLRNFLGYLELMMMEKEVLQNFERKCGSLRL
jgi:hypothetical protein